ncbi:hypothetical protein Tsubulata_020443 [Turnera subulata]|uniref:Homologous recombination OB-fold protein OB-fold domain-containing protein n=1 Tax=Turnera subulata TaxID=218843 RepID=A0A9Q0GHC0_9ROSI|nr:hypothetical protein Tsubulata_020443 [Turnera subulata]
MGTQQTPWEEALDLGDGDDDDDDDNDDNSSASLLLPPRPLKRQRAFQNPTPSSGSAAAAAKEPSLSQPFLRRCHSLLSQSSPNPPRTTQINLVSQPNPHLNNSSSVPSIPGPAGTVQAAILRRKNQTNGGLMGFVEDEVVLPTQEYIRRAVEDGGSAVDDDFARDPWLSAVDFVRREGLVVDGDGAIGVPLSSIRSGAVVDKVAQVVAIVKSCTPNGLGDMMVTLKDPTGSIDASIHRRVLTEMDCGKDISVGAAIIVQKVCILVRRSDLSIATCLFMVISQDGKAPMKLTSTASKVKNAAAPELFDKSRMTQKELSLSEGRTEGIMNSLRQNASMTASARIIEQLRGETEKRDSSHSSGVQRNKNAASGKEHLVVSHDVANATQVNAATGTDDNNNVAEAHNGQNPQNQAARRNITKDAYSFSGSMSSIDESKQPENRCNNEVKNTQPPTSRASLPQWTDEQLEELFAFD